MVIRDEILPPRAESGPAVQACTLIITARSNMVQEMMVDELMNVNIVIVFLSIWSIDTTDIGESWVSSLNTSSEL